MSAELEASVLYLGEDVIDKESTREENEAKVKRILKKRFEWICNGIDLKASIGGNLSLKFTDDAMFSFVGSLDLGKVSDSVIHRFINRFCSLSAKNEFEKLWLNFRKEDLENELVFGEKEETSHKIKANHFAFGTIVNLTTFMCHFKSNEDNAKIAKDDLQVIFKHDQQSMTLLFRERDGLIKKGSRTYRVQRYKLELDYGSIRDIVITLTEKTMTAYLLLKRCPLLFQLVGDTMDEKQNTWVHTDEILPFDGWVRVENFDDFSPLILSKSNVLSISFPRILRKDKVSAHKIVTCPFTLMRSIQFFTQINVWFASMQEKKADMPEAISIVLPKGQDSFPIQYAILCLESLSFQLHDYLIHNNLKDAFRKMILDFAKPKDSSSTKEDLNSKALTCLEDALFDLFYELERNPLIRILPAFEAILNYRRSKKKKKKTKTVLNENMVLIRRAVITPSKILYMPKYPFLQCKFTTDANPEFALRVQLRDDHLQYLGYALNNSDEKYVKTLEEKHSKAAREKNCCVEKLVEEDLRTNVGFLKKVDQKFVKRVKNIARVKRLQAEFLERCIKQRLQGGTFDEDFGRLVGKRKYRYIGSSTSQLRDYGLFLYATDDDGKGRDAKTIQRMFGTIEEKNVAKFVARLGLNLSQVLTFVHLQNTKVEGPIADLKTDDEKYTFSDGVGMVSEETAREIFQHLKDKGIVDKNEEMPSAYQIRFGGCKGLIVVWPERLKPELKGRVIQYRDSMKKFTSDDLARIGIIKTSGKRATFLNRPFVTLLEQLGTKQSAINKLLKKRIKELYKAYISEEKAAELLFQFSTRFMNIRYNELTAAGINLLNEAFFRKVLENCIQQSLRALKEQARIQVPIQYGRTMFGVVDETRTLMYGQVFVQPTHHSDRSLTKPLTGRVMVTKFPCMHPGDVRLFEAVDLEDLHHIKDCIVFPAEGHRPHPDEMAGSDLDGDEYSVIWDSELFIEKNYDPMDYTAAKAKTLDEIRETDIHDFYLRYVRDYSVGRIASAHLAWADKKGIFDPICMGLAKKYAISLDFAKTGCNETLSPKERVAKYPDFMQKFDEKSYYLSTKALGSLYRAICVAEHGLNVEVPQEFIYEENSLLVHPNFSSFMKDAEAAYSHYTLMAKDLQKTFHIETEAGLISSTLPTGFIENTEGSYNSKRMLRTLVRRMYASLREEFHRDCKASDRLAKASAYYLFTYGKVKKQKTKDHYFGLPWVVADYLVELARVNRGGQEIEADKWEKYLANLLDNCGTTEEGSDKIGMALEILREWLKHQDSFYFGVHHSGVLVNTEIEKALNREVVSCCGEISIGELVLSVLKSFAKKLFHPDGNNDPNLSQLSIVAMRTLQACFKTNSIKYIIQDGANCGCDSMGFKRFQLTFTKDDGYMKGHITFNEKSFKERLKVISNCKLVYGDWYERQGGKWLYYITAYGTQTSLALLTKEIPKIMDEFQRLARNRQRNNNNSF